MLERIIYVSQHASSMSQFAPLGGRSRRIDMKNVDIVSDFFAKFLAKLSPGPAGSTSGSLCLDSSFPVKRLFQRCYFGSKENSFKDWLQYLK